jgi:tetratricopeptide (TPR) repeat protein
LLTVKRDDPALWRLQAKAYLAMEQPLKAAQNYEYLRLLGAADANSLAALGDIYLKNDDVAGATEAFLAALGQDPAQAPDSYIQKAKRLAMASALDEARKLLAAVETTRTGGLTESQRKELLRVRAWIAAREGADPEQVRLLEEIVQLDPTDGDALISLGQYQARTGNPDKAVFCYERAAGIKKVEARAKIAHAQLLVQQSRYDQAVPLLKSALLIEPRDEVAAYLKEVEAAARARR